MARALAVVDGPYADPPEAYQMRRATTPETPVDGINLSMLQEFNRCRYRWDLRYNRGIERRSVHAAMDLGSMVHAGISFAIQRHAKISRKKQGDKQSREAVYVAARQGVTAYLAEWEKQHGTPSAERMLELEELANTARSLAIRTVDILDLGKWETVLLNGAPLVEQRVFIPFLDEDTPFHGTKDWVARDRTDGSVWVIDYKVREHFTSSDAEEVDLQSATYQYMLARHGIRTAGSIKVQVRNALPGQPNVNKNGSMSRQRILTTWEVYRKALITAGLDPKDYQDEMEPKLDAEFFRLDRTYRNDFTINAMFTEIVKPNAIAMRQSKRMYREMNAFNCNGCWAREFCLAELTGDDTGFLLETDYIDTRNPAPRLLISPDDVEIA